MIKAYLIVLISISASGVTSQVTPLDSVDLCYHMQRVYNDMEHGSIKIRSRCINAENWGVDENK